LVSRRVGQPSNRRLQEPLREAIRALLVARYPDFGPTLAREKRYELHQIEVSSETVRQLQVELGLWRPKRRQAARAFQWRERRWRFGELIQIDGSPHDWFEGRGPRGTLIVSNNDLADANTNLPAFMADLTRASRWPPSRRKTPIGPLLHRARELDLLLSAQEERTLSKNLIVQYHNIAYQIRHDGPGHRRRGAKVTVCALTDGEVVLLREGRELPYTTYRTGEQPPPDEDEKTLNERVDGALEKQQRKSSKPALDHPWRQAVAMAAARSATSPATP